MGVSRVGETYVIFPASEYHTSSKSGRGVLFILDTYRAERSSTVAKIKVS